MKNERILLSHGSGGKLSHQLIETLFIPALTNPVLETLADGAVVTPDSADMVMTTDSYVVDPIFFPGGDIGKLAVSGTVNDLAVMGAVPRYLSLAVIIEEGLPLSDLRTIVDSIRTTCEQAGVQVITGDTKVVPRGNADKIFINTTGIGFMKNGFGLTGEIKSGDKVLINGTVGDHGTTIMAHREGLKMESRLQSDCAPLNRLIDVLEPFGNHIRMMRDPTRGGVATVLNELVEGKKIGIVLQEAQLPVKEEVRGLCEILGLDPLYIANEGKVILIAEAEAAPDILAVMHSHPLGKEAAVIGTVSEQHPGKIVLQTGYSGKRIVDMLTGEQLPRIC